jgi:hypothetical protein
MTFRSPPPRPSVLFRSPPPRPSAKRFVAPLGFALAAAWVIAVFVLVSAGA